MFHLGQRATRFGRLCFRLAGRSLLAGLAAGILATACLAERNQMPARPSEPSSNAPSTLLLRHRGYFQFQFDGGSLGASKADGAFPAANGIAPFPATERLLFRRFRTAFDLKIDSRWSLFNELNLDFLESQIQVLDLRLDYRVSDQWKLSAGRFKVPFGWEGLRSSRTTHTVERSDMTVALYPERDIGLSVTNKGDWGEGTLGAFLGQPRGVGGFNNQYDLVGRASFNLADGLKLGASGHVGTFRPNGTTLDLPVRRAGTDLQWTSGRWSLDAETIWSDGYNPFSGLDSRAFGYQGIVVYRVSEPLDLVLSYDRFDPDLDRTDAMSPNNASNSRDRKVAGITYHIDRAKTHRVMLNYEIKDTLSGPALRTQGPRLRYQVAW